MPHTLLISDLHLCESRPQVNTLFLDFLCGEAQQAAALYILGDLFEYWIGDDDLHQGLNQRVTSALASLATSGTRIYFMAGNRDFLIGERFAAAAGLELLPDSVEAELHGHAVLLLHGDTLCTGDGDYQRFRSMVRSPAWQRSFLEKPLEERRGEVEVMRRRSEAAKQSKTAEIMDVTQAEVERVVREHEYRLLIHGHTHRPAHHEFTVDSRNCERWVLPDWHQRGGGLRIAAGAAPAAISIG